MGGSGGSFLGGDDPQEIAKRLRGAERSTEDEAFKADVEALLGETLAEANDRDVEAIAQHIDAIQHALEKEIDGVVSLTFGGSVAKHTYAEGISDVDALIVLNETELARSSPETVCARILAELTERLKAEVTRDGFAIAVQFKDVKVELVPVIRRGEDYLLPDKTCKEWSVIRPRAFTDELTATNKDCGGKVIPTIKLAKVLLSDLPEERRPNGYHLENLALRAFTGYRGPFTPREMLHHFFKATPALVREPIPDRTGQSSHVDEYLGPRDSVPRLVVADTLARIGRRLLNADGSKDLDQWRRLLGTAE